MRAGPVIKAASGGVTRRRTQTIVIFIVLLVSTAAATLSLALLEGSSSPWLTAFAAQRGADVALTVDTAAATGAQLTSTTRLPGVTAASGPFAMATVTLKGATSALSDSDTIVPSLTVVGRSSPGGPVDDLVLQQGQWPQSRNQIVLSSGLQLAPAVGSTVTVTSLPGNPKLTVVGVAQSITDSAGAWVLPSEMSALQPAGSASTGQMLYQFASASSSSQVKADVATVARVLPAASVTGTVSWLTVQAQAGDASSIIVPFVTAFALIGLVMSVLIVANVISGAVIASYRRIGVLKSIGFTPAQVIGAYVAWVAVPTVLGCLVGLGVGNLLAIPVLDKAAQVYGVGGQSVPLSADIVAPLGMCLLAGIAALLPALRAGRFSAVEAIAAGRAPQQGSGYAAHRLLGKARLLPRPVTVGLAAPFARPTRTAVTLIAVMLGATAVIYAVGLNFSLARAAQGEDRASAVQLEVTPGFSGPVGGPGAAPAGALHKRVPGAAQPSAATLDSETAAAIRGESGTLRYVAEATPVIAVPGLTKQVSTTAFDGDASWVGYDMISGHWYNGPGQVDVNTSFLQQSGLSVGEMTRLTVDDKTVPVRIVGEVFDPTGQNDPALLTSWQTLGGTAQGLTVSEFEVGLKPGVSAQAYINALDQSASDIAVSVPQSDQFYTIADSLIALLTLMMAVVAALGVLNTVLLGTRERVHDLGVFKAVGMTPRQTLVMVVCWIVGPALGAVVIAIPVGLFMHDSTMQAMGRAAHTGIPASFLNVYSGPLLAVLALAGLVIAAIGALLPASWAARARTATALRTE